jgi:hypothetical protein
MEPDYKIPEVGNEISGWGDDKKVELICDFEQSQQWLQIGCGGTQKKLNLHTMSLTY